ncbi:protein O-mannosyl-transferase TMTC4-like, partial [Oppia nitens]|uniref:protein O-mannosyl-transferase TMTC4-like n=1 Tax=Oppia nitens TaxID=1686743 RepID=UPI0023DB1684
MYAMVVSLVSIIIYSVSLMGDFVFDDTEAILNNRDVMNDTSIGQLFVNDFWGTAMSDKMSHKSYRPLTVLVFRLLRFLSHTFVLSTNPWYPMIGEMNAFVYHLFNVLMYTILNVLLLIVLNNLLMTYRLYNDNNKIKRNAFLATLLFTSHPIHTESVSACVGAADLLSSMFALISLLIYLKSSRQLYDNNCVNLSNYGINCLFIISMSTIAMLFKELGITFIGLCIVFDLILMTDLRYKYKTKLLIYRIICLTIGTIFAIFMRFKVMDFRGPKFQRGDNPSSFEETLYIRIINYNYIYAINAWILIFPDWLCFDWSMSCIPLIKSFYDFRNVFIIIFWMTLLLVFKSALLHKDEQIRRQLQISLSLCLVPFIPSSNIFFRVGFVVAERALFLPSIGFVLIIIIGINIISNRFSNYSKRNFEWTTEKRLFSSGLRVCPLNAKVHYNIAKNAADFGDKNKAIEEYREAIRLNPVYEQAFNNLANILKDSGYLHESSELLIKAVKIRPTFAAAWMNLGIVQTTLKQYIEAEVSYLNAIKHRNRYPQCLYNLGNLYVKQNRYSEAYKMWMTAIEMNPTLLSPWNNLIIMLDNTQDYHKALDIGLQALVYHTNESSLLFNIANVLGKLNMFNESETYFMKAIALNPNNAQYFANLGVLYHRFNDYTKAITNYKIALQLNPKFESVQK